MIPKYIYNEFEYIFYDDRHVEPIIKHFLFLVKLRIDKLDHPAIITEWIHNMDTSAHLEQ